MTSRDPGRHRAPPSPKTPTAARQLPQLRIQLAGSARPVAKVGAVLAVSGGLVASLGLQATAAPPGAVLTTRSADASVHRAAFETVVLSAAARLAAEKMAARTRTAHKLAAARLAARQVAAKKLEARQLAAKQAAQQLAAQHLQAKQLAAKQLAARKLEAKQLAAKQAAAKRSAQAAKVSRTLTRTAPSGRASSVVTEQPSGSPAPVRAGAPGSAEFGAAVLAIAARYAGIAYRYGGTTPAGFDCSGFTSYVLAQVGIDLPRTSSAQRGAATRVSRSEAVPGDLVFTPGHVGIYAGNGMMWDSPRTGDVISRREIYSGSATYGRVG